MNVTERFLKYVSFDTQSDSRSDQIPSTPGQLILGSALAEELKGSAPSRTHTAMNLAVSMAIFPLLKAAPGQVLP